ncbi:MAG TPA: M20 family metallopeptidase [Candidatus Dormibacteraeota bacterium]|nr:M20 family metallopeptidase [Candidatus Dormibacteraeota bacterium]
MSSILEAARALAGTVIADRRAIHRRPELAYHERETAALVASRLEQLGIPARTGIAGTGVIGLIEGGRPGRTVLLRADMDALPIQEGSDREYASQTPGVMHACGHDAHTAILLGVSRLLVERRGEIAGNVKLMFQPAEEGGAGALRMIEEGVLDAPPVDAAFMLHVSHQHPVGTVATAPGPVLAGANAFTVTIDGRGGHASRPHQAVDPVVVAAQVVCALQTLVGREVPPTEAAVLTLGRISAGTAPNVIPDRAELQGTIRAYRDDLMQEMERRLEEVASGVAEALRASARVDIHMRYPPTVNDPAMAELLAGAACAVLGPEAVLEAEPEMAAEDFSFVLQRVPGAMLRLGVRSPEWPEPRPVHTARFELDESALPIGVAVLAEVALEFLSGAR